MSLLDRSRRQAGDVGSAAVESVRRHLLAEIDLGEVLALDERHRRVRLERVLQAMLSRDGPVMSARQRAVLVQQVVDEALGLGVLEPLLADESITEIMVNGPHEVYVEREGRLERIGASFTSEDQLRQTIDRIVARVNRRVDESSPMVDARLEGGERVNVIVPPLAVDGPSVTIRRFPRAFTLDELVARGSLDPTSRALLETFVRARLNIVVAGGTGTGKTTMLNALSTALGAAERIVTIEDSAELRLRQPHVVRLEARPPNTEGSGEVTIRDLVRNSLRMRPDRIIVGEVRGGETLDMLQAMNTGHEGSLATVHANSPADAITRLETLAGMSGTDLPVHSLRDQVNSAIDAVVQVSRDTAGRRWVSQVAVMVSRRHEPPRLGSVFLRPRSRGGSVAEVLLPRRVSDRLAVRDLEPPDGVRVVEELPEERAC